MTRADISRLCTVLITVPIYVKRKISILVIVSHFIIVLDNVIKKLKTLAKLVARASQERLINSSSMSFPPERFLDVFYFPQQPIPLG